MNFAALLPQEAVFPHLKALTKKQALKALSAEAAKYSGLSAREIFSTVMDREEMGSTGMGNGVCIPHGRFEGLKALHVMFAKLDEPIEFGAADGKPVDMMFLLLTPAAANTEHLKALAIISKFLRDKHLCKNLRSTDNAVVLHDLLIEAGQEA
jgi:PTS system nitrogen regulatory IIA component